MQRAASPRASRSLARLIELIDRERAGLSGAPDVSAGYLNLLGEQNRSSGIGQNLMQSTFYPLIYRPWRAVGTRVLLGQSVAGERKLAKELLGLESGDTVLDVACGPGNFTEWYGKVVGSTGLAVGLDLSETMLAQAVSRPQRDNVAYLRGDALDLPFADATFDAACCFLALFLMPDPMRAVSELMRVVRPGGRVAIMAPTTNGLGLRVQSALPVQALSGVTFVSRRKLEEVLTASGLSITRTRNIGTVTYVGARKP